MSHGHEPPLHVASFYDAGNAVLELLGRGADVDMITLDGEGVYELVEEREKWQRERAAHALYGIREIALMRGRRFEATLEGKTKDKAVECSAFRPALVRFDRENHRCQDQ